MDYKLNGALAIRVARLEYLRSRVARGVQVSAGMVRRLGTW